MCNGQIGQFALAGITLICAVVVNVWGEESENLNTLFTAVISSSVWGGYQRGLGESKK